ncbi:hypothetical protein G8C92_30410 [Paenibacillus donghaensis]|uniref:RNA polymerase sigma factor n=1 Tax=Paenibacillus donghaensis TaxID=414771 RepID=UPI0018834D8C|nr:hypothetical protein [Paenibacillus donghaensis]MBE9918315.1 hypothetical protein [Paenibacillus donghaensis]
MGAGQKERKNDSDRQKLYNELIQNVYTVAYYMTADEEAAEWITEESMLTWMQQHRQLVSDSRALISLYKTCLSYCFTYLGKPKHAASNGCASTETHIEWIQTLPAEGRAGIVLCYVLDLGREEAGEALGKSKQEILRLLAESKNALLATRAG